MDHFVMTVVVKLTIIFFMMPLWGNPLFSSSQTQLWKEAHTNYEAGIKATTYEERRLAFNQALFLYDSLEKEISPSPTLDHALGDTYFQLNEYPWALFYYSRALKKKEDEALHAQLVNVQNKLGLTDPFPQKNRMEHFFQTLSQHPLPFFGTLLLAFVAISIAIWFPQKWTYRIAMGSVLLFSLVIANGLFFYYFTPLEGMLISATGFYRAPSQQEPQLTKQPLKVGSKVVILQIVEKDWVKVMNQEGIVGYIPLKSMRSL